MWRSIFEHKLFKQFQTFSFFNNFRFQCASFGPFDTPRTKTPPTPAPPYARSVEGIYIPGFKHVHAPGVSPPFSVLPLRKMVRPSARANGIYQRNLSRRSLDAFLTPAPLTSSAAAFSYAFWAYSLPFFFSASAYSIALC